jgi:hypothetical protein
MTPQRLAEKTKGILQSPSFFRAVIVIFVLQALLSAVFISASTPADGIGGRYVQRNENGVVPDGHRHLGAIYYYAERPLLAGPVLSSMDENDLWMGDLVRFPSYLYYYVLSFPVRAAMALHATDMQIILLVRSIGIILGLLALIVFRRITALVTNSRIVQNLSALALSLTGSFVWLSAAENYDIAALLLWFAFIYAALALFTKNHARYLYWMALWFSLLGITKYTYIPFAGLAGLSAVVLYIRRKSQTSPNHLLKMAGGELRDWLRHTKKWSIITGLIVLLLGGILFSERIVGNLIEYRSFNPGCTQLHSQQGCMKFGVYARNYKQKQLIRSGQAEEIHYNPLSYLQVWVKRYYDSMYVYMGH